MNVRRLVLAVLCALAGILVFANAPALAATNNAYQSQFNGSLTSFIPRGLAVNAGGDVYVVDRGHEVVDEFGPSGTGAPLAEFKASVTAGKSFYAESVAVNASGDVYVIGNESPGEHNVVDEFRPNGTVLAEFNGKKTAGESFYAESVAVNAFGDVYVADVEHALVDEFSPPATGKSEPKPLAEFNGKKTAGESFTPKALAVNASASGDVYVVDSGHNVVDEFSPPATGEPKPLEPEPLAELTGVETPLGSWEPFSVAVAASGEVYVVDAQLGLVDRFNSFGTYLSQFEGGATPQGWLPQGLRFEAAGDLVVGLTGEVYVTGPEGAGVVDLFSGPVTVPIVITGPPSSVLSTSATLTGSIDPSGGPEATCEFRYGTETSYGSSAPCVPAGPVSSLTAVTADLTGLLPETTYHYRLEGTTSNGITPGADETLTTPAKPVPEPTVTITPVTQITSSSATFNGEVNPNGAETAYHFEYSPDGVNWTPLKEESAGEGTSAMPVTQTVSGLTGHTPYDVRLVAHNAGGPATSTVEPFLTLTSSPQFSGTGATDVTAGEATLHATIHTENNPTTYRFEYGPTASYGATVPAGEGDLGASGTPTQVSQAITGLSPNTTYHFRVVASNGVGVPTATPDQTFTTFSSAGAPGGCPNEQVREESAANPETGSPFSMQLPECRAYEMVSPPVKNGAPMTNVAFQGIASASLVSSVGSEGSALLVNSTGIWPGGEQPANNALLNSIASEAETYRLTRGESGWGFRPEVPSALDLRLYGSFIRPYSNDINLNGIFLGAGFAPSEQFLLLSNVFNLDPNLYRLEPDGAVAEIGPSAPPSERPATESTQQSGVEPEGASTDLSRTLFSVETIRWPFDHTKVELNSAFGSPHSLYEYVGTGHTGEGTDVPTLVGVDNEEAQISECGTKAGGPERPGETIESDEPEKGSSSISGGGSTVFFTALAEGQGCSAGEGGGPLVNQLFARVGEPGAGTKVGSAVTVNVAGSTECATSDSCNVTKAVEYQRASADGSKVFFTSEQPSLIAGETDTTNSLYECRLPGDSGASLTRMAAVKVNPCPDLVSVSGAGAGAEVQSVVAVPEDGSHVYFTAKGVLTGENAEHNSPTPGQDNLYVWQEPSVSHPLGHTAFIVTLPSAKFEVGGVQATPDGNSLVFTSAADLTAGDTSTVSQVFLYEASHEALVRVSKGQNGFNHDGNTTTNPASIYNGAVVKGRRVISEDGSTVVFESSQALTAQVHGGIHNVYLWRGGNVYLISDGTTADESIQRTVAGQYAGLVGIDASGQNVFFTTETHLVGQDGDDLPDLYDARIGGGFPAPKVNACSGEACQGALSGLLAPVMPGSLSPGGVGNVTPPPAPPAKPTVEILKIKVTASTLLVTVRTSAKGRVQISGKGLTTTIKQGLKAGTHQIKVKLTKAGRRAGAHRKKTRLRVSLTVGKQTVAKTTSVKL